MSAGLRQAVASAIHTDLGILPEHGIEGWFSVITRKAVTNTSFNSDAEVSDRIDSWASHWNDDPQPFASGACRRSGC